ncbi:MAG: DJ-1/PfpI family protein [Treponema sp.]|nr:DJ-1/PfpI family protein [Treponema sp.]
MKRALVLLADGFEDVEAITPIDYLRRAGIEVTTASITENLTVTSKWGEIKIIANTTLSALNVQLSTNNDFGAVILPGGMTGAENLAASEDTGKLLCEMHAAGKLICAICASPAVVLAPLGILDGRRFTCYPGQEEKTPDLIHNWSEDFVVIDGNVITSRAAGTAGEFAVAIIEKLLDKKAADKIVDIVLM